MKQESEDKYSFVAGNDERNFYGVYFLGEGARKYWRITCPCGTAAEYPVNGLPTVDTPHPCGNAKHWTVKFDAGAAPGFKAVVPSGEGKYNLAEFFDGNAKSYLPGSPSAVPESRTLSGETPLLVKELREFQAMLGNEADFPEMPQAAGRAADRIEQLERELAAAVVAHERAIRTAHEAYARSARSLTSDGCTTPESHGRFFSDGRRRCDTCGAWGDKDSPLRCTFVSATGRSES